WPLPEPAKDPRRIRRRRRQSSAEWVVARPRLSPVYCSIRFVIIVIFAGGRPFILINFFAQFRNVARFHSRPETRAYIGMRFFQRHTFRFCFAVERVHDGNFSILARDSHFQLECHQRTLLIRRDSFAIAFRFSRHLTYLTLALSRHVTRRALEVISPIKLSNLIRIAGAPK